jgi:hypothetical protein
MASGTEISLEISLRRAESLVRSANGCALALEDLGSIDLPPMSVADVDQAQLRAIAVLYLAAELEVAGVIPAAEGLTRLSSSGGLTLDLGNAASLIHSFWKARNERASEEERRGFFSALFGTDGGPDHSKHPPNAEFENLLIDLCEALYKLDEQAGNLSWGGVAQQSRLRGAARRLLANLLQTTGGITAFLAEEILASLRAALKILNHQDVKAAFGARSLKDVVAALDRRLHRHWLDYDLHARRGQTGMTILAWLAEAAPFLETDSKPIIELDNPVIPDAIEWLEVSLKLVDATAPMMGNKSLSPWATVGG